MQCKLFWIKASVKCINLNRPSPETAGPSKKPRDLRSPTDLDVVLDTYQEIVTQYKYVYDVNSSNHSSVFLINRSQTQMFDSGSPQADHNL